ncbi:MAG: ABC transporter ATP-binding protein/permease [Bacteroidia bacterium]|nr:ABC transporter ATP-binding protein/permease [Bacteroidia bacterium]
MSWIQKIKSLSARKNSYGGDLSLKESFKALQFLPPFLRMIWETDKWLALGNIILRLIQAGIPVTTLYIGKLIIDEVVALIADPSLPKEDLWTWVGIELGITIVAALLSRLVSLIDALLGDKFSNKTSVMLIEHAAKMDLPQFEDAEFYDKLERARRQSTSRTVLLSQLLRQGQDIITVAFLAGGLIIFNPWLIVLLVIAVIPSFISETHFNQRSYSIARSWTPQRRELDYLRYIGASDRTAKEIKIFGLENHIKDKFSDLAHNYYLTNRSLAIKRSIWGFFLNSFGDIGYYIAYFIIISQTIDGTISLGDLTFLSGSFARLRSLLRGILSSFSSIAQSALYLKDLFDFLAIQPGILSPENPLPLPKEGKFGFEFKNVGFKYPNSEKYAIKGLSFQLEAGEKLALVGENGAGKTTLVKLLARLYDPTEGTIFLNGHDLRLYDLKELRKMVGVIFQDFVKFDMTAQENISIGNIDESANRPLIETSAEKSMAIEVIEDLPKRFDQMLGRRFDEGMNLSGGQWQKIALARAYMRNASLMILDEPTAALDARAEYSVFQRFSELTKGRTAVLISHRFSTVRMADRILVLEKGQMKELGSHEELLEKNGTYSELFNLQAEGYK